ncbi:Zn-dependent alcohol dehydrogenase [Sphingopyxis sp.]|jgi:S-(hydroxymethyl)glutathione dehydrogenase/alcohol dehydrogenase|uniref:Zn-dependent alcohol dehydrogenase n=1 Tax=Sphingopyxis sp. TaxID=1908224 RepID=UPI002DE2D48B|nr:Zn-dependent alcohol dehydrogenase [Sphingopyxis sp.]
MTRHARSAILRTFGGPVSIEEVEVDDPADNEVLVRTCACGICHSDLHYRNGAVTHFPVPSVMGHEAAGIVEKVGKAVTTVREGDKVVACNSIACGTCKQCIVGRPHLCRNRSAVRRPKGSRGRLAQGDAKMLAFSDLGGLSEYMLLHERAVVRVDDDTPLDRAALLGCAVLTGMGAVLNTAQVTPGSSVVVFGCGGVGSAIVQGARIAGARTIIAVDVNADKLAAARKFGATHVVDSSRDNALEAVADISSGGTDYAFDAVGRSSLLADCFSALAPRGLAVLVGSIGPGIMLEIEARGLLAEKRLTGSFMGSNRFQIDIPYYLDLYRQGRLDLDGMISERIGLDGVEDAFRKMEKNDGLRSVVVFD